MEFSFNRMADSFPHSYILLRNISDGYPRGALLDLMKDGSYERHAHTRFYIIRARTVRCDKDGDVAPLREVECYLSYDIGSDADRYGVYSTPGKLEWGTLCWHDYQYLKVAPLMGDSTRTYMTAIIRWCGRIIYMGYMFGVEIMVSSYVYS